MVARYVDLVLEGQGTIAQYLTLRRPCHPSEGPPSKWLGTELGAVGSSVGCLVNFPESVFFLLGSFQEADLFF